MKRAMLAMMGALALAGCKTGDVMSAGSVALGLLPLVTNATSKPAPGSAAATMTKEIFLDTNRLYVSTAKRISAAVDNGRLTKAYSPDARRPDFCKLVEAVLAQIEDGDVSGKLKRLDCQAEKDVSDMEDALGRGDAVTFAAAKGRATGRLAEMDTVISAAEKSTPILVTPETSP